MNEETIPNKIEPSEPNKSSKLKPLLIVLVIVILGALAMYYYYVVKADDTTTSNSTTQPTTTATQEVTASEGNQESEDAIEEIDNTLTEIDSLTGTPDEEPQL